MGLTGFNRARRIAEQKPVAEVDQASESKPDLSGEAKKRKKPPVDNPADGLV